MPLASDGPAVPCPHIRNYLRIRIARPSAYIFLPISSACCTQALRPNAYLALVDEVTASANLKRATKAVQRTDAWTKQCLAAHYERGFQGLPLACITGGRHLQLREKSAQLAAQHSVAGECCFDLSFGNAIVLRKLQGQWTR